MAELFLVEQLQLYLVAQGVGQLPAAPASSTVPSIIRTPREGTPVLRDGEEANIGLVDTNLAAPGALEAWLEEAFVDVIVTARQVATARLIHRGIRNLIHPIGSHGGRTQWMMNLLLVEYSTTWRGEQPLRQDNIAYARVASYRFCCRRKALAGTPALP